MTAAQQQRLATAVGFLLGVYAVLHVLRDATVTWPLDALWAALGHSQRLELSVGIALMAVNMVISVVRAGRG
jgi:hypothetical protein